MNFQEAEQRYQTLEKRWAAGQLSAERYHAALANLRVVDASGQIWMIQEHSGRWFVFHKGRWVEAITPVAAPARPAAGGPSPKSKRSWFPFFLIAGLLGTCLLCAGLGGAGYLIYQGQIPLPPQLNGLLPQLASPGAPLPGQDTPAAGALAGTQVVVQPSESVAVVVDGAPHADSRGVSLSAAPETLAEGGQITLSANELNAPWRKAIETAVTIETPFYSLAAPGKNDSTGGLALSFPAASPRARLLAVIDGEYLVELAQVPQDGRLTLQTRAGPSDTSDWKPPAGYDGTGSIYYAVITPKSASRLPSSNRLVGYRPQADERNCIPDLSLLGGATINICRQNPSGTVQVMLPVAQRDLAPQADIMVDKIGAVMDKYYSLGFTTAQLSRSSPMLVRVSTKVTSPSYYPLNGVLYIPVDTVTRIATLSPTDVYHEMAHWIQAVKYSTRLAYYSGERTWWLETAAENMVMLVEPGYVGGNLRTYGAISNADNTLALQSSPYQWPGDYYIQAQLVKVNLCDDPACPLSPTSFAKAISEGTYPLMNGSAKSMISQNLKDYAFYLLGKPPARANSAIPRSGPVSSGEDYGEYVRITRNNKVDLKYDTNGADPQVRKDSQDGKEALLIEAKIQRDGVYPLVVLGGAGQNPGLPVELDIQPGAPFYYTINDGDLQYSDGSQELKLLPIHGAMGIQKVRLVAIGENGGEVFKARVQPLNLDGAWAVMVSGAKTGGSMNCSGGSGTTENPDGTAQLMAYVASLAGGMGDMQADPTGRNLDWSEVASRVPAKWKEGGVTFKATALLAGDALKYQASVVIPKADKESALPPVLPVAAGVVALPPLWLMRKRLNVHSVRVLANLLVIAFIVMVSTGCFGMDMYGNTTVDAKFQKIEYVGGQDQGVLTFSKELSSVPQGKPLWKLTGSGTYNVNFYIETTVTDANGKDSTEITTCAGQVTYPITAYIYRDFSVVIPEK